MNCLPEDFETYVCDEQWSQKDKEIDEEDKHDEGRMVAHTGGCVSLEG